MNSIGYAPRVFSVMLVFVEIDVVMRRVVDDVFQHGSEPQGVEDLRLGFARQVDRLGVAAPFDVEDAVVAPAMLVVADELPLRVGRERRLAGAGQAEQDRRLARSRDRPSPSSASTARRAWASGSS